MQVFKVNPNCNFGQNKITKQFDNEEKRKKQTKTNSEKIIFGLIREELNNKSNKESDEKKISPKKKRESNFNSGRWLPDEHKRFIEALLKYGNDWKNVQNYVGSRSATQARSHAQKVFVKIGKIEIENLQLDFENNSLRSLNMMTSHLSPEQLNTAIKHLNNFTLDKFCKKDEIKFKMTHECNTMNILNSDKNNNVNIYLNDATRLPKCLNSSKSFNNLRKKRLRTISKDHKKKRNELSEIDKLEVGNYEELSELNPIHLKKDDVMFEIESEQKNQNINFYKLKPLMNPASNRRNSIDLLCPTFNFINDNSIFISNPSLRDFKRNSIEEKEGFKCLFENSFKFDIAEQKVMHGEQDFIWAQGFSNTNYMSRRSSGEEKSSSQHNIAIKDGDIIIQFMD